MLVGNSHSFNGFCRFPMGRETKGKERVCLIFKGNGRALNKWSPYGVWKERKFWILNSTVGVGVGVEWEWDLMKERVIEKMMNGAVALWFQVPSLKWFWILDQKFLNLQQRYFGDKTDKGGSNFTTFGAWHRMAWHALACVCVFYEWNCPPLRLEEVPLFFLFWVCVSSIFIAEGKRKSQLYRKVFGAFECFVVLFLFNQCD